MAVSFEDKTFPSRGIPIKVEKCDLKTVDKLDRLYLRKWTDSLSGMMSMSINQTFLVIQHTLDSMFGRKRIEDFTGLHLFDHPNAILDKCISL